MRAALLVCLLSVPGLAAADDTPAPSEPLVEPVPIQDTTEKPAPAQENYEKPALKTPIRPREIVIEVPGMRTKQTRIVLGSLLAAGTIGGLVGVYFHLGSRSAANDVSQGVFNGRTWTPDRQARFDEGERDKTRAGIAYAIGGAFVIGAIATLIATDPKSQREVIRPRHAGIVPVPGGAVAGAGWSF
jgi:hypothetical protein